MSLTGQVAGSQVAGQATFAMGPRMSALLKKQGDTAIDKTAAFVAENLKNGVNVATQPATIQVVAAAATVAVASKSPLLTSIAAPAIGYSAKQATECSDNDCRNDANTSIEDSSKEVAKFAKTKLHQSVDSSEKSANDRLTDWFKRS